MNKPIPIYAKRDGTLTLKPVQKWVEGYRGGGWYENVEPIGYLSSNQAIEVEPIKGGEE